MTVEPIEFELLVQETSGADWVEVEGEVTSPALDPLMHPEGKLAVRIETAGRETDGKSGFVLDSFQLRSLLDYLRLQDYVRETLDRELPLHQEVVDPEGDPVRGDVWSWARVRSLQLRSRELPTGRLVENLRSLGHSARDIKDLVPPPEPPKTRSSFVVTIDCNWDQDHGREARFRDGVFVGFDR